MRTLPRFSFGVGDRFGHEATAPTAAFQQLARDGIQVAPVWNKSHREHGFIGSKPDVRTAAAAAISESGWEGPGMSMPITYGSIQWMVTWNQSDFSLM